MAEASAASRLNDLPIKERTDNIMAVRRRPDTHPGLRDLGF